MKVTFNDVEEFLRELEQDASSGQRVSRDVVRVTFRKRTDGHLPIFSISVVAGYCNEAGELVELVENVGQVMQADPAADDVWKRGQALMVKIKLAAERLHLSVRTGAFACA